MFVQLIILGRIDLVIIIYRLIYIILYLLFICIIYAYAIVPALAIVALTCNEFRANFRSRHSFFLPYACVCVRKYINIARNAIAWNKIHIASTVGLSWIIRTILFH